MPAKIRLQRRGSKGRPFYHIVVADGRAPRDGRFIEKIGTYNPLSRPAEIELDFDKALNWLQNGAQPTDTARAILSYKGVMYKNHLLKGVTKGALTEEQAQVRFDAWLKDKEEKISQKAQDAELETKNERKSRLEAERKVNEARANAIAEKLSAIAAAAAREAGQAEEEEEAETAVAEVETAIPALSSEIQAPAAEAEAEVEAPEAEAEVEAPEAEAEVEAPVAEAEVEAPEAEKAPEADVEKTEE